MEVIGIMFGLATLGLVILVALVSVLYPVFWVWMLVDAITRDTRDYPGGNENDRLLWVLLMAFVNIVSVFYFFMVYRRAGTRAAQFTTPSAA